MSIPIAICCWRGVSAVPVVVPLVELRAEPAEDKLDVMMIDLDHHAYLLSQVKLTGKYRHFHFGNTDYQDFKSYKKPNICGNL
jgi:hypothetical protein